MSVLHKIFIKDFKLLKCFFFFLTFFFLYGEIRLFFVEKPSLTSVGRSTLAPEHFPEILICKIEGYDKEQLNFHGYETSFRYAIDEFLYLLTLFTYLLYNKTFSLGVPFNRTFVGWIGKNGNFTVKDVEDDVSAIKNIRLKIF